MHVQKALFTEMHDTLNAWYTYIFSFKSINDLNTYKSTAVFENSMDCQFLLGFTDWQDPKRDWGEQVSESIFFLSTKKKPVERSNYSSRQGIWDVFFQDGFFFAEKAWLSHGRYKGRELNHKISWEEFGSTGWKGGTTECKQVTIIIVITEFSSTSDTSLLPI